MDVIEFMTDWNQMVFWFTQNGLKQCPHPIALLAGQSNVLNCYMARIKLQSNSTPNTFIGNNLHNSTRYSVQ